MVKISKLVWTGLAVNIASIALISLYLSQDELVINYEEPLPAKFTSIFIIIFSISIVMQIISLFLLSKAPKTGRAFAFITTVLMLPWSMIFYIGYLFSYEWRYNQGLTPFVIDLHRPLDIRLGFNLKKFTLSGIACIVLGIVIGLLGINTAWVVVAAGLVTLINAFRLEKRIMIGLAQDKLIITPAVYADTYIVPLSDVTLIKDKPQSFKLQITSAGVDRTITITKRKDQQVEFGKIIEKIATGITVER